MTTLKSRVGSYVLPLLPINRRTFDILRYELRAILARVRNILNPFYWRRIRQLSSCRDLSVNIGSGGRGLPDWVNIELVRMRDTTLCLDIRRRLPIADESVSRILAEHVLEHIDFRSDVPVVLRDWYSILRPGGVLRIV